MAKKKMTVPDFKKFKQEGRKFTYVTAYDYTTASIVNESETEVILVGDSLGMVMLGYDTTVGVTLDDMIHHIRPVVKGAPDTFIVGDMPFGSYQQSPEQAIASACRILMETHCDCVKLEGGAAMAETIRRMVEVGIPVMGHIGLTPQSASSFGGFKMQGGHAGGAAKLIADARALEAAGVFSIVLECVPSGVAKAVTEAGECAHTRHRRGPVCRLPGAAHARPARHVRRLQAPLCQALRPHPQGDGGRPERLPRRGPLGEFPTPEYSFNRVVEGYEL